MFCSVHTHTPQGSVSFITQPLTHWLWVQYTVYLSFPNPVIIFFTTSQYKHHINDCSPTTQHIYLPMPLHPLPSLLTLPQLNMRCVSCNGTVFKALEIPDGQSLTPYSCGLHCMPCGLIVIFLASYTSQIFGLILPKPLLLYTSPELV